MDPRISETLRYVFITVVAAAIAIAGYKGVRNFRDNGRRVDELRLLTTQSSFYHQFYPEAADHALLQAMAVMHECEEDGLAPQDLLDKCFNSSKSSLSLDSSQRPADEQLVRRSLIDNYENCRKLGLFAKRESDQRMRHGELPAITTGPSSGDTPIVARVIDASIAPGLDKVVANLEIRPPGTSREKNDVERAAAHQLARELTDAGIIDSAASSRIHAGLDGKTAPTEKKQARQPPAPSQASGQPVPPTPAPPPAQSSPAPHE